MIFYVDQNCPVACDENPGTEDRPFLHIQAAAQRAMPGDTVLIRAGVYRECVVPARGGVEGAPISYVAAPDERVSIRGTDLLTGWTEKDGLWEATLPDMTYNPFAITRLDAFPGYERRTGEAWHRCSLGQLFLDDAPIDSVDEIGKLKPGRFFTDGKTIVLNPPSGVQNPNKHAVEITTRKAVFRPETRGLGYLVLDGLNLEMAANQAITCFWEEDFAPQQGIVSCRSGHHWTVRNCAIRFATSIGIDVGSEGRSTANQYRPIAVIDGQEQPPVIGLHLIEGNAISDNGQCGLCGLHHYGTVIRKNVFERNNSLGAVTWEEAAIKTHFFVGGVIEDNVIRDNGAFGIWLDNVYQDVVVRRNLFARNHGAGIFFEMGGGPALVENNVFAHTLPLYDGMLGQGIYGHEAGGMCIRHNLFVGNASYGVFVRMVSERDYSVFQTGDPTLTFLGKKHCHAENIEVTRNLFVGNRRGSVCLPAPGTYSRNVTCDENLIGNEALFCLNHTCEGKRPGYGTAEPPTDILPAEEFLPLETWREKTGWDARSEVTTLKNAAWQEMHDYRAPYFVARLDSVPTFPAKDDISPDWEGRAYGDTVVPGPFQRLRAGERIRIEL